MQTHRADFALDARIFFAGFLLGEVCEVRPVAH